MDKTTLEQKIIRETKMLSEDSLHEILNFVLFIKSKKLRKTYEKGLSDDLNDLNNLSLTHLEEEFKNYKELYPHES